MFDAGVASDSGRNTVQWLCFERHTSNGTFDDLDAVGDSSSFMLFFA